MRAVIDAQRARHELGRPRALQAVRRHVVHLAVKAVVQARRSKPGFGARQVDTGDADLGKSERTGPCRAIARAAQDRRSERRADRHSPILETPPPLRWPDEAACAASAAQRSPRTPGARATPSSSCTATLGAGKTTFVRHLLRALGVEGRIKSPTYAVVEPLRAAAAALAIWHFDFYRFDDPREWEDAGFRDVFAEPGPEARRVAREGGRPAAARRPAHRASSCSDDERAPRHASTRAARARRPGAAAMNARAVAARCARRARWCCCSARARSPAAPASSRCASGPPTEYTRVTIESDAPLTRATSWSTNPHAAGHRHRRPRAEPAAARAGRQGARRRSVHRRHARRPEPAARRAPA